MDTHPELSAKLREYLSAACLQPLWLRLRGRLERNGLRPAGNVMVELDEEGALHLSGILSRTVTAGQVRVDLAQLDKAFRESAAQAGLVSVMSALDGPLVNRPAARDASKQAATTTWQRLDDALSRSGLDGEPWVPTFLEGVRRAGLLTRAGDFAAEAIVQAGETLGCLASAVGPEGIRTVSRPAEPRFELAELASQATGDAHGLDDGRIASALVLRAVAAAFDLPVPASAAERRNLWAAIGVTSDLLSGTVLVWGLRPTGADRWARMMRERADLGLVTHLTLQELRVAPTLNVPDCGVFACENPQVLQAAVHANVPQSLLCFSGNPSSAGFSLLDLLLTAGTSVQYHGDFDWPGIAIADRLIRRGASPWRLHTSDYEEAADKVRAEARLPLAGPPTATPWDPQLRTVMIRRGIAIHEENLLTLLLSDLGHR